MNNKVTVDMPKEDFDKAVKSGVEQAMKECELTIGMTVKEAVEKQIPKKPRAYKDTFNDDIYEGCPSCEKPIVNVWNFAKYEPLYCHYCGQRLKWGD